MNPSMAKDALLASGSSPAAPIDWQAIQQRMIQLQATTQQGIKIIAEEKLTLLKERAIALARSPEKTEVTKHQLEVAEFRLGEETYALPSTVVSEVYPFKDLTPLPCTPSFVLGVTNVRGRILPLIDLASLLGLAKEQVNERSTVILIKSQGLEVGIVTNLGINIRSLSLATLHPPLATLANLRARYLQGITSDGIVVLDATKLLTEIRLDTREG